MRRLLLAFAVLAASDLRADWKVAPLNGAPALWHDGRPVPLKVVDAASAAVCGSDLRQRGLFLPVVRDADTDAVSLALDRHRTAVLLLD